MKKLLLIDDNDFIRENTAEILELGGYTVRTADSGRTGVALALEHAPDLVLCDIMMPELDGYGVLHIFRQHPQLAHIPFVFLTAKTERTDVRKGMELGADDYLTKPFVESELLSAIAGRLARFEHRPTLAPHYDLPAGGLHLFLDDAQRVGQLAGLSADRKPHAVARKQRLYAEGDEATRLYFLQSGRVKTSKTTAGGKELITGLLLSGDFFGYKALLAGTPHHDTAETLEDSVLLYIPADDFTQLLLRHPEVSQQFVRLLAGRVGEQEELLLEMAYNSLRKRVADTLVRLHAQQLAREPGQEPHLQLSRDDLAALVGTAPESLSRTLSEFRQAGLLEVGSKFIHLLQPDKLQLNNW